MFVKSFSKISQKSRAKWLFNILILTCPMPFFHLFRGFLAFFSFFYALNHKNHAFPLTNCVKYCIM